MRTHARSTAIAAVAALVIVAAGCGDGGSNSESKPPATSNATTLGNADESTQPADTTTTPADDDARSFDIAVAGGQPKDGPTLIKVKRGDHVEITITADADGEAHLHGIDKELELKAGEPGTLEFDADAQGSYELELHGTDALLATVEVR